MKSTSGDATTLYCPLLMIEAAIRGLKSDEDPDSSIEADAVDGCYGDLCMLWCWEKAEHWEGPERVNAPFRIGYCGLTKDGGE